MIYFAYLTKNKEMLRVLLKMGYLSTSVPRDMEIFKYYSDMVSQGNSRSISRCSAEERFKVSTRKMYRIINRMEQSVP
jgi:hypothetical protein